MKTNNDAGHQQNVINFEVLISFVLTLGESYNPPKPTLTIPILSETLQKGKLAVLALNTAEVASKNAIAARTNLFNGFDGLITRVISSLRIVGVSALALAQAEAIVRDLRGKRATGILTEEQHTAAKEQGTDVKQVAVHNASMDKKIENFNKFILFLESIQEYSPNEPELTVPALKAKLLDFQTKTAELISADAAITFARLSRNEVLYATSTGLVDTALEVKLYVKSLYGATSPQYTKVNSIAFVNR